ncbi:Crp/Fnr family transcriptional regulator [Burkholderia multivorans]|uniref:Crp/Fnr family transcriptional regulator n=1 Tax=Burkholderia multivorans TaxID=87883 RepID=UPI001FC861BF|nr:Crp/Fnr family transcriptional regulator [Burkholderia multivorans]MCL4643133.1 Crp/Fnr family transcriptional regulator [Burkholderia multivorans]UQN86276.1 Crp/Fnr family transcriptional regulator [Burkholderia multivorans]UQO71478.1 Crp/Fnr family transcriptional regulator [Burkholderia multivorans]UQP24665.1 Crp/Fnr family transcriptional regulator [Burkholderia multivorans]UQP36154.1 Crp/Fnr family transcriptional regulator [Burkholderia multivorans]
MRFDLTRDILRLMHVNTVLRDYFLEFGADVNVDANKPLLRAGEVAKYLYLIQSGAVRLCVRNAEGAETTVQFFFEDDMVCSLESMLSGCPSGLELITMEACQLRVLDRDTVLTKFQSHATMPSELLALTQQRLVEYINLYTIAIAQTPTQRYQAMLVSQPDKLARIPLHILASYLGVTPVHLSRIRRRLKAGPGSQAF